MNIDLRNNDCLDELSKMKDASVDCIVTSPPYWKGFAYEAYFNSYAQYLRWSKKWMKECKRVLKPNGKVITCGWNSGGIGKCNGMEIKEILLVPHGGWHNDTIVTVEEKQLK